VKTSTTALAAFLRAQADAILAAATAQAAALRAAADVVEQGAPPPARLLSSQDCAAALGVSVATLNRRVGEGAIPYVTIGDSRRFDLDAVRAALAEHAVRPAEGDPANDATAGVRRLSRERSPLASREHGETMNAQAHHASAKPPACADTAIKMASRKRARR
jgi:excisionase family DNA binding protein